MVNGPQRGNADNGMIFLCHYARSMTESTTDALGAELAVIPRVGHYPWVEHPSAFLEAIKRRVT